MTHFPSCPTHAAIAVMDLVTRKWLNTVLSAEETSTQVQVAFIEALEAEGILEGNEARADGSGEVGVDNPKLPVLLAVSDNGPQMTSESTREFMAMCAIAQHFGRPGTPADQAWVESLFGHVTSDRLCLRARLCQKVRIPNFLAQTLAGPLPTRPRDEPEDAGGDGVLRPTTCRTWARKPFWWNFRDSLVSATPHARICNRLASGAS